MSNHIGAKLTYPALPGHAKCMIGDKGYDSDEYRAALKVQGMTACIPPRKGRLLPASFDKSLYRQHHKIENMFSKLKDWRRIHSRYDSVRPHFLVRNSNRSYNHLLAQLMSPDPKSEVHSSPKLIPESQH